MVFYVKQEPKVFVSTSNSHAEKYEAYAAMVVRTGTSFLNISMKAIMQIT